MPWLDFRQVFNRNYKLKYKVMTKLCGTLEHVSLLEKERWSLHRISHRRLSAFSTPGKSVRVKQPAFTNKDWRLAITLVVVTSSSGTDTQIASDRALQSMIEKAVSLAQRGLRDHDNNVQQINSRSLLLLLRNCDYNFIFSSILYWSH